MRPVAVDVFFKVNSLGLIPLSQEDLEEGESRRRIKELDNSSDELYWGQPTWEGEEIRHGRNEDEDEDEDDNS